MVQPGSGASQWLPLRSLGGESSIQQNMEGGEARIEPVASDLSHSALRTALSLFPLVHFIKSSSLVPQCIAEMGCGGVSSFRITV